MWQVITAGATLGMISSFHCAGMCGPIALALPVQALPNVAKKAAIFLYHSGRICTYTLLGLLFGLLGRHFYLAGFQKALSITAGILILLFICMSFLRSRVGPTRIGVSFFNAVQKMIYSLWNKQGLSKFLAIGILNGFLPCGMVYFALAGALSFGTLAGGLYFMVGFGLGTLPLILLVQYFGMRYLSIAIRNNMKKAVPVFVVVMGVVLILRGLNLGIPYISPFIGNAPGQAIGCHN
jgi:sulfite exporter TauE/SafE